MAANCMLECRRMRRWCHPPSPRRQPKNLS